ncbi:hypothetical protein FRC03_008988 [Tulasnella sp. 419]|nr:hypothetical protein FRC02_007149 [Tulasnella sp. 418]KAG8967967.1 hypothetical protein FRC03_008988 [Tulasnella sp. 419]
METAITLAKSNLTLAVANNEMLEDALRRETRGLVKDIGWRRWSEREGSLKQRSATQLHSDINSNEVPAKTESKQPAGQSQEDKDPNISSLPVKASVPPIESSRFFGFRFGTGTTTNSPAGITSAANRSPAQNQLRSGGPSSLFGRQGTPHLTSPSLPSLLGPTEPPVDNLVPSAEYAAMKLEIEALRQHRSSAETSLKQCQAEKAALFTAKTQLEEELESLSQALFEAANKMVAEERKKRAAYEEELEIVREEKEALKGALQLVEAERSDLLRNQSGAERGE